jgi:N-glycosylase/DNA lyase
LKEKKLLFSDDSESISNVINSVRFKNKKAKFIILAKNIFINDEGLSIKKLISDFPDNHEARNWFVKNIKGIGLKEASHFLRNIGFGKDLAILDRHILKNLKLFGVIDEVPQNLSGKKYSEIEKKMKAFSKQLKIDMESLDFTLWYKEAKEVFK